MQGEDSYRNNHIKDESSRDRSFSLAPFDAELANLALYASWVDRLA